PGMTTACVCFFSSSRRRHTRSKRDWSSDVCSSDLEYLCMKNGEERGFTAAEFRTAQADGWEKQYPYKVGRKKVYMTPSAAETQRSEERRVGKESMEGRTGTPWRHREMGMHRCMEHR